MSKSEALTTHAPQKPRREYGEIVSKILWVLENYGPMTTSEICEHMGIYRECVSTIISRMAKAGRKLPKRIYIKSYVHDEIGQKRYPRAIYDIGDKPNAKRPRSDKKAIRARYNAKIKSLNTTNFVFNLALPRKFYSKEAAV